MVTFRLLILIGESLPFYEDTISAYAIKPTKIACYCQMTAYNAYVEYYAAHGWSTFELTMGHDTLWILNPDVATMQ